MRVDQGLAWMVALVLSAAGASGFYWWATYVTGKEHAALLHDGEKSAGSTNHETNHDEPDTLDSDSHVDQKSKNTAEPVIDAAEPVKWGYQGSNGPRYWARLDKDYLACASPRGQSPVDLDNTLLNKKLKPIVFNYRDSNLGFTLRGQDLVATVSNGNYIEIEGERYNLISMHLHTPSEHHLQSVPYEMEIQLNHRSPAGDLAILGVFVAAGTNNENLQLMLSSLPRGDGDQTELSGFPITSFIPRRKTYFHYTGSLTQPPCTKNVAWYFFTTALEARSRDIEKAVKLVINNTRPIQKIAGRKIHRSNR